VRGKGGKEPLERRGQVLLRRIPRQIIEGAEKTRQLERKEDRGNGF